MLPKIQSKRLETVRETAVTSLKLLKIVWGIDRKLSTAALVAIVIPAIVPFINIYIYKLVIDLVVQTVSGTPFDSNRFFTLVGVRVVTYFLQDASFRTQQLVSRLLWTKIPIEINRLVFQKISSLDVYYFENDKFRNLLEKVREAHDFHPQKLVDNLLYSFQSFIQVTIAFFALANLNWFFVVLILVVAIPEFVLQSHQSKLAWGIWNEESQLKKRFHYLQRLLEGHREHKEVKLFGLADRFLKELTSLHMTFYRNNTRLAKRNYFLEMVFNIFSTAVFIGIEIFVIFEALAKRLTVGDINFYTGVVSNFQNGLGGLLRNLNNVFDSSLYVSTIFEVLDIEPVVKKPSVAQKLNLKKPPTIEFKSVSFTYPDTSKKILDNFSIKIGPGEKIALVGENGAGKSTIIKLLVRFYDVDSGEILINGINIKELDLDQWYEKIGVLFQDFNRYEDSAKENIYLGDINSPPRMEKIIEAATSAGAHKMVTALEKGYSTMLGRMFEGGIELSGGQWQKMALSRAFFRNAPVLVLDEPTASIDARSEAEIFDKVEKLSKDRTVIIISHRFSTVRNADKIYVIENGKIIENGSHEDLININGQYAALFHLQAKGYR